jgi:hypothetical protein
MSWYAESFSYDYSKGSSRNDKSIYHFTQMVWKDTSEVGFGLSTSKTDQIYVVANYKVPGNIMGQFTSNVLNKRRKRG